MKIFLVAGARPNFMKIAPIVRVLKAQSGPQITQITQITPVRSSRPTPVPSPGATPVKWLADFTGQAGQADYSNERKR